MAGDSGLEEGQILSESREIRNGIDARLQIDCGESLFRLGANSTARIDGSRPGFHFEAGSCLFAALSDTSPLLADLGGKKLEIVQGTGFAHKLNEEGKPWLVIGSMAGKTKVKCAGKTEILKAGELVVVDAKGSLERMSFDLPKQVQTCALITDFKSRLPNQNEVDGELARFTVLKKRGFIGSPVDERFSSPELESPVRQTLDATGRRVSRSPGPGVTRPPIGGDGGWGDRNHDHTGPPDGGRVDDDGGPPTRPGNGPGGGGPPGIPPGGGPPKKR